MLSLNKEVKWDESKQQSIQKKKGDVHSSNLYDPQIPDLPINCPYLCNNCFDAL